MSSASADYDLVVVGCGIGGLSAAVSATQGGCRVAVLERAPREHYGGNSRWTESYFRMKDDSAVAEDFETSFANNAGHNLDPHVLAAAGEAYEHWPSYVRAHGFPDPELVTTFAQNVVPTVHWLKSFGVRLDRLPIYFSTQSQPRISPVGGGLALIEALSGYAARNGSVTIHYETTARKLLQNDEGAVVGIAAAGPDGKTRRIGAPAVVLASGGFEGNPEMLARYLGARAAHIRPVAPGGYYNKGEGIRMALDIGAAPAGDYGSYHSEPVDPRSRQPEAVVFVFPYGIIVNAHAERFLDEAPGTPDMHYDHMSRRFADQPGGLVHVICDRKLDDVPNWQRCVRSDQPPIVAETIEALANAIGVPAPVLARTVQRFNAACPQGKFDPIRADGLATMGLDPPKSNWARALDAPPYRAYPLISANCFTFGGLKVDTRARVLDGDGRPIHGLYAAGETVGLYYQVYTGATSVLKGAVFGRIAGLDVAAEKRMHSP